MKPETAQSNLDTLAKLYTLLATFKFLSSVGKMFGANLAKKGSVIIDETFNDMHKNWTSSELITAPDDKKLPELHTQPELHNVEEEKINIENNAKVTIEMFKQQRERRREEIEVTRNIVNMCQEEILAIEEIIRENNSRIREGSDDASSLKAINTQKKNDITLLKEVIAAAEIDLKFKERQLMQMSNFINSFMRELTSLSDVAAYNIKKTGENMSAGVTKAGELMRYGVTRAGEVVKYSASEAGKGIVYGASEAGKGMVYGASEAGKGMVYGASKSFEKMCQVATSFLNGCAYVFDNYITNRAVIKELRDCIKVVSNENKDLKHSVDELSKILKSRSKEVMTAQRVIKAFSKEEAAAIKLQAVTRGHQVRSKLEEMKGTPSDDDSKHHSNPKSQ